MTYEIPISPQSKQTPDPAALLDAVNRLGTSIDSRLINRWTYDSSGQPIKRETK